MSVLRRINPTNFLIDVARGLYPDMSIVGLSSHNPDVDSGVEEDIWANGGTLVPLTSAETLDIVSDSTNDILVGTGGQTLQLKMLDANYDEVTEDINLNGTTPVTSVNSCLRLQSAILLTAGTSLANEGNISITATIATTPQGFILIGKGTTQKSHFTIPNGKTGFILSGAVYAHKISGGGTPVINIKAFVQGFGKARIVAFEAFIDTAVTNNLVIEQTVSTQILEKADIKFTAASESNNTLIFARLFLILIDN